MQRPSCVSLILCGAVSACSSGVNKTIPLGDMAGQVSQDFARPNADLSGDMATRRPPSFDLSSDQGGPTIVVVTPAAGADVEYNTLHVTVMVTATTGAVVDGASVFVTIPATGKGMGTQTSLSLIGAGQYSGAVDISAVPQGPATFIVTAADTLGRQTSVQASYVHDSGPIITFIEPTAPTAHGSINLEFLVTDTVHTVDAKAVTAGIRSGSDIALTLVAGSNPLHFTGVVTFNTYMPALDGNQLITVTATNSSGVVGKAVKPFTVDNQGPIISFVNPVAGAFVGGVLQIAANVSDLSGVNPGSVLAIFGGDTSTATPLTLQSGSTSLYAGLFDVRKLGVNYVLPIFSIRATDTLGNGNELGEEIIVDNTPPDLELDPAKMRVGQIVSGDGIECSQLFDPVGKDAANDGDLLPQIITLRARVEDQGNTAPGLKVVRVSGIVPTSVTLYAIPAGGRPLAVDTDGDGKCDDVNPNLVPTADLVSASNQAVAIALVPIPPAGIADYSPPVRPSPSPFSDPNYGAACNEYGTPGSMVPEPLCLAAGLFAPDGSPDFTVAIPYTSDKTPAIWTIPPVAMTPSQCVGFQFDSLNRLPGGLTCIAVRAQDAAGNSNVSPPLLVCIEHHNGADCNEYVAAPPGGAHCVGTYSQMTKMDSNTPCTLTSRFASVGELRILQ